MLMGGRFAVLKFFAVVLAVAAQPAAICSRISAIVTTWPV